MASEASRNRAPYVSLVASCLHFAFRMSADVCLENVPRNGTVPVNSTLTVPSSLPSSLSSNLPSTTASSLIPDSSY